MIIYALGQNGKLVHAKEAVPGISYICPVCGVPLYVKTSCNGVAYYAVYPGHPHIDDACRKLESSSRVLAVDQTKPGVLLEYILAVPKGGAGGNGGGLQGDGGPEIGPIKTLRQAVIALAPLPSDTKMDGGIVRDVIIADNDSKALLSKQADIGPRIIGIAPMYLDYKHHQVWGHVYWHGDKSGKANKHSVSIVLQTHTDEVFKNLIRAIGGYDKAGKHAIAYKRIWVCGNWHHVPDDVCTAICNTKNCGYGWPCCGMFVCDYHSKRQMVVMQSDRIAGID